MVGRDKVGLCQPAAKALALVGDGDAVTEGTGPHGKGRPTLGAILWGDDIQIFSKKGRIILLDKFAKA